jgi:hypothetical protein
MGLAAQAARTLTCVGLYSETSAGSVSYRVGSGAWTKIKVGDKIPEAAEIRIDVDRDWVELIETGKPTVVFELIGPEKGAATFKCADVLKGKGRTVKFPKAGAADPAFKDKLVVTEYLGRQIYTDRAKDEWDIKYGAILERGGKVTIIAINNTLTLTNDSGQVTTVIGPLKFTVADVLDNKSLYKFLNVTK